MYTHQIKSNRPAQELMKENMLVKHYAGSLSYGTNLPSSDVDFRGIFCADPINIRTPFFVVRECDDVSEEDTKLYELSHFMKLCLDCNPNIIETLWVDEKDIVFRTPAYDLLRENRHKLLSSKIAFTTSGYALAQLKRIKGHNKWINNPHPVDPPRQIDFVSLVQWFDKSKLLQRDFHLSLFHKDYRLVPFGNNLFGVYAMEINSGYSTYADDFSLNVVFEDEHRESYGAPLMIVKWNKEEYKTAKEKHRLYWSWKQNRNEARGELEEQFGFDTKHAMHLVRLLRMGVEALTTGEIIVKRPDAKELLDIRNGSLTYDEIVEYAEQMDATIKKLYLTTDLPKRPNLKFAANLLMETQDLIWNKNV